jgi:hypothetical protein
MRGCCGLGIQMLLENAVDERVMQNCEQNLPENAVDAKGIKFAEKDLKHRSSSRIL